MKTLLLSMLLLVSPLSQAGWLDWFKSAGQAATSSSASTAGTSSSQVAEGLKQALEVAAQRSVSSLGREGGFSDSPVLRIPLPDSLEKPAALLRSVGQGAMVDEFELSMNRAAEKALSEALPVFKGVIESMTVEDALGILNGANDAATRFFQDRGTAALAERFEPLVEEAMAASQVAAYYKTMLGRIKAVDRFGLVSLAGLMEPEQIETYIVEKSLQGSFHRLAEEEAKIRDNPAARSTELLKTIFGR